MKTNNAPVRHAITALTCTVGLLSLAACQGEDVVDSKPSTGASAGNGAAGTKVKPNGVEKLSAKQIYNKGHQALADAGSFREKQRSTVQESDVRVSATECVGTVSKEGMGSWEIVRKGKDIWINPDAEVAAWVEKQGEKLPQGEWLHGTPDNPLLKGMASYCHHEMFANPDKASVDLTKGKAATVDGMQVIPLVNKVGDESMTYHVATTGEPYVLKRDITREDLSDITYSEFGQPVGAKAPTAGVVEAPND